MLVSRLFLDDIRHPNHVFKYTSDKEYEEDWNIVRNYEAFKAYMTKHYKTITVVSFDHDLGREHYRDYVRQTLEKAPEDIELDYDQYTEKTGYDCAKFMIELYHDQGMKLPRIKVHSMNVVGKQNIIALINGTRKIK